MSTVADDVPALEREVARDDQRVAAASQPRVGRRRHVRTSGHWQTTAAFIHCARESSATLRNTPHPQQWRIYPGFCFFEGGKR